MCIGIPLRIRTVDGIAATCDDGSGSPTIIDLSLLPEAVPGDWVLTFLGAARRRLDPDEAALLNDALSAMTAALRGERDDDAFADLTGRTPTLPPHLEAARAAGRSEG
ncbi:HypC/HybG/HupF family hydrogenase formation chaperone [Azospirillum doebereinerae]|uniref:HypC/HybG/HupF family hydrogenase formation chaperone n=1 Tax=Azospirillum doebereinerae TaxID=92933 RepID=A0A433J9D4_9PROT|nr:HypC/HybG/HupF family hydrogenase formation chaperone [Azospirillum doebereinerae]MCG5242374.1 HypC/HybG/HupF family hydrogenase formation chaperone [Azospirillum doebereinerae]RUQ71382.1 HypC/HybG/HupF family hydrogenase formation chaperone [Azospirillum doebereinerae]